MLNGMSPDNRHKIALPYWARPGIRLMAKPADTITAGPDADDDDDDDDEDDEDEEDDPDAGKSEDELRAELKRVRASLGKANGSSAKKRTKVRELEAELERLRSKPKPKANDDDEELDVESIKEQARREGQKAGDDRVKGAAVREALAAAGVSDEKSRARLARMVDLDELDLNDDGSVDGLDDAIDELKSDLPALFAPPRRRRTSVAGDDDRNGDREPKSAKTASQKAADKLLGR